MATHKQVRLEAGDFSDEVDAGLAPFLREIWLSGFETVSSCENATESIEEIVEVFPAVASKLPLYRGCAYVDFWDLADVEQCFTLIARGEPSEAMRERMSHFGAPDNWRVAASIHEGDETGGERGIFVAEHFQLILPVSDLAEAEGCLRRGRERAEREEDA